jgi:hypothetical protein
MKTLWKKLIFAGTIVFLIGTLGIILGIFESFRSIHINESAGIGAVGAGLQFALIGGVAGVMGGLLIAAGLILLLISRRSKINK